MPEYAAFFYTTGEKFGLAAQKWSHYARFLGADREGIFK
jgi:hypothetical protein